MRLSLPLNPSGLKNSLYLFYYIRLQHLSQVLETCILYKSVRRPFVYTSTTGFMTINCVKITSITLFLSRMVVFFFMKIRILPREITSLPISRSKLLIFVSPDGTPFGVASADFCGYSVVGILPTIRGRDALDTMFLRQTTSMPEARVRKSKYISYLLRFLVAAGALYLTFRGENFTEVFEVLLGLNLWIFAGAIGVYVIAQLIFVVRWSLLLKVQSIRIGFWPAVRLHFLGLFYNNCLPGALGGDLPRAWYVTRHTDKKLEAALSVFVDRVVGLIGMLIMAFGCYWFIPEESREGGFNFKFEMNIFRRLAEYKSVFIWLGAVFAVIIVILVSNRRGRMLLQRGFEAVRNGGASILSKIRQSIRIYCHKWPAIIAALLLTFCCQAMTVVAMWLVGREIGIDVPAKYYFIFFPISWLLGAVPISVGGLGIMEGWLKMMFMRVGTMSGGDALALALCQRLIFLLASLPGAVIHFIGAHLPYDIGEDNISRGKPKDFFIDSDKPAE